MTTERWSCLWVLVLTAAFAAYQFRAAEMNDDSESAARERTTAWVAVLLAVMALYGLIFDPTPRYPR
jgi:putative exporter of polyketide antibiotics